MSFQSFFRFGSFAIAAAMLTACADEPVAPTVNTEASTAETPVVQKTMVPTDLVSPAWQEKARELVSGAKLSAFAAGRVYAALSVAQQRGYEIAQAESAERNRAEAGRGAVAGASATVLGFLFPAAINDLEALKTSQGFAGRKEIPRQFTRGVAFGEKAGAVLVDHLKTDRFTVPWDGTGLTGVGYWIPNSLPPAGATLGNVKPYFLTSGSQFRPGGPYPYNSPAWANDLLEIISLTQSLTPAQVANIKYWDSPAGTPTPAGLWNATAEKYILEEELNENDATEVFAMMHAAMFDAFIACWDAKYTFWALRPYQGSPLVKLTLAPPNHPSFPSGHSCISAASARVLAKFFPKHTAELDAMVAEAGMSRMLAGIHFRLDVLVGQILGRQVADWDIAHADD